MKRYLLAAVAALAIGGTAYAQGFGPPPPPPQFTCPGAHSVAYWQGCAFGYQILMKRWRAQMEYWRALHDYRAQGGN
jgi:hypothetical protein